MNEADRDKNCLQKLTWPDREAAYAAAVYARYQYGDTTSCPKPYRCKYCNKWHLAQSVEE